MSKPPSPILDLSHAGLLIAAHGSPSTKGGRTSSRKHTETILNLGLFADARAGFLTEKPFIKDVLDDMHLPEVYVVPNLACRGFVSTIKLPQALNLTGEVTERITPNGHQRVHLCDPVGTDPSMAKTFAVRILATMDSLKVPDTNTAIVVIGHGSGRGRESFEHTNRIARDLSRFGIIPPVFTTFLEEPPFIKNWRDLTRAKNVIFAPYLISDGFHGSEEVPRDIGFNTKSEIFIQRLAHVQPNEMSQDGQRLIYLPPLGDAPEMAELIINRVRASLT
jgi:sirohydrochlorin cobaltochelatase